MCIIPCQTQLEEYSMGRITFEGEISPMGGRTQGAAVRNQVALDTRHTLLAAPIGHDWWLWFETLREISRD
jgi:hypothetical protein